MPDAQVSFAGNLTDDPELRHTDGGIARATLRVAVSGRRQSEPSFLTVVVLGPAEHMRAASEQAERKCQGARRTPSCSPTPLTNQYPYASHDGYVPSAMDRPLLLSKPEAEAGTISD
jgi:Single-strand binding protein family